MSIKLQYPLIGCRQWRDGPPIRRVMFLTLCESELLRILRECRNAMVVGLRSLVKCMAYRSMIFNRKLPLDNMLLAILINVSRLPPSSPQSPVPPLSNAEPPSLYSSTTPSRPPDKTSLPCLRARGFVNTGSMCFANAVLQLLVHPSPFWNLFRKLGDLKEQCGAGAQKLVMTRHHWWVPR